MEGNAAEQSRVEYTFNTGKLSFDVLKELIFKGNPKIYDPKKYDHIYMKHIYMIIYI